MSKRKKLGIPPRWIYCPRMGQLINDLFIPFKTPLDEMYEVDIPPAYRFNLENFLDSSETQSIELIIDLTKTKRFYKSAILTNKKQYSKIECEGHKGPPNDEQVTSFKNIVNAFTNREENQGKYVGVHCTHGFNRTGFMIVCYLVEECDMELEDAIMVFNMNRKPGIYKQEYIDALRDRYQYEDPIEAPPRPSWCEDENELIEDEGEDHKYVALSNSESDSDNKEETPIQDPTQESTSIIPTNPRKRKKPGHNNLAKIARQNRTKQAKFMDGVDRVYVVRDCMIVEKIILKMQQLMNSQKLGFLGSQPVSMTRENMELLLSKPYRVSWKADGVRYMMLIIGRNQIYMIDRDNSVFKVEQLAFPCPPESNEQESDHLYDTILDGEMVIDVYQQTKTPRYLVYDIVTLNGQYVGNDEFCRRLCIIKEKVLNWRNTMLTIANKEHDSFRVRDKPFYSIKEAHRLWHGSFRKEVLHELDGLIFQPSGKDDYYEIGTCGAMLKWKPPELNSVDFLLKVKYVNDDSAMIPHYEGHLYVTGLNIPMAKIMNIRKQEREKYNGKIVECVFKNKKWEILRERTDKSLPNHISTARSVGSSIEYPVTIEYVYRIIEVAKQKGIVMKV